MIIGFVGTPGSGKSYEAVKKILDNLKAGRVVCTNIDGMDQPQAQQYIKDRLNLSDSEFSTRFRHLSQAQVLNFWGTLPPTSDYDLPQKICPDGCLIVIDEAHKFFNARDWQSTTNRAFSDWASTHRHAGYDLVLVTQDIEKIDKQCRSLIEWTYFFRKINFLGSAVKQKYLCYSYTGDDHNGKPLAKNTRTYDAAVFPAYSSYSVTDAKEIGFMTHVNVLKHPVFFIIPVVLCFCLWMLSKSSLASGDLFGAKSKLAKAAPVKPVPVAPTASPAVAPVAPVALPVAPFAAPAPLPYQVAYARPVRPSPLEWDDIEKPKPPKTKKPVEPVKTDTPAPSREYYVWYDDNENVIISNVKKQVPYGVPYRVESYD